MASFTTPNSPHQPTLGPAQARRRSFASTQPTEAPDSQLVAKVKHEINALVQEVTQLASQDIAPADFYRGFLPRVVSAMAAVGGAVWTRTDGGQFRVEFQVDLAETGLDASPQDRAQHAALLKSVVDDKRAMLVSPRGSSSTGSGGGNPTALLAVVAPLIVDEEPLAVVEIFQRPGGAPNTERGYLRFLLQMCDLACGYLKSRQLRQIQDNQSLSRELGSLVAALYRSLDVRETSYAIANEGRRLIGCDRLSLAIRYGHRCQIVAVSGLDSLDRRAAQVTGLSRLAQAVLRMREPLWSAGDDAELPSQIQKPLQAYLDQSHARLVAVIPLQQPARDVTIDGEASGRPTANEGSPIGALIVEQFTEARAPESLKARSEVVARHSSAALSNAIEHSSLFLLPLWKAIGQIFWLFRGRAAPATLLTIIAIAGFIYALATVQTDFEIAARGKLQPMERREIFAPLDGQVKNLPVEHGQIVEAGALLAELTNTDLDLELAALLGRQTTNQERQAALSRALLDNKGGAARLNPADENRLSGEMLQLRQEAENIERELTLVREKQQQLKIIAPQRGQVVTWKVRDLLLQRPVTRGQGLLTLANPDGPWELELYLPERRLVHVQNALASRRREPPVNRPLDVTFIVSSHPGQTFHGNVVEIEQAAEVRSDKGNCVLVRVAIDKNRLPPLKDQTTVTAKLNCGRASVGYDWFCDLIETVQTKVLFWLPL